MDDIKLAISPFTKGSPERPYISNPFAFGDMPLDEKVEIAIFMFKTYLGVSPQFYTQDQIDKIIDEGHELEDDERWRWMAYDQMETALFPGDLSEFSGRYDQALKDPNIDHVQMILGHENGQYKLELWVYGSEEGEEVMSVFVSEENLTGVIATMLSSDRFEDPYFIKYFG